MTERKLALGMIPFGVVVLVEPGVSRDEMCRDLDNIRALDFNTVVLYPSVSRWEGEPFGHTAFGAIDTVMDDCAERGLKVVLELQGQVMQDADAPECFPLPVGFPSGNYRENGFHQPAKEALLRRYFREVVAHFKGHPALLAYDLFNEIGNDSRSPGVIRAFVEFLRSQYGGDVVVLNRAWATYFSSFEAIAAIPTDYRVWSWTSVVAERDWQRFRSSDFTSQIAWWRTLVREIDPDIPLFIDVLGSDVLINRTDPYYGVSDWDAVAQSDILGLSCYANMLDPEWWRKDAWLWPQFWRHARSVAGGKQVVISEMMTQNRTLFPREKSSMTDELRLWSHQALFHGIQGMIYWKYRPFRRGRQVGGRGLTDFSGEPNHFARQASEAAGFAMRHAALLREAKPDDAGCCILFDPEAERLYAAIGFGSDDGKPSTFYTGCHRGWFRALWAHGISPSYVTPARLYAGITESVRLLVVPCLASVTSALAALLKKFVEDGGTLLTESRFGLLDGDGNLWDHAPGAGLHQFLAMEEINFSARFQASAALPGGTLIFQDDFFQEIRLSNPARPALHTAGGAVLLSESQIGKGRHFHIPFLFGHKIEHEESTAGALAFFSVLAEKIRPALHWTIEVISKDCLVDISVLLDSQGRPRMAGICNFAHKPASILLRHPRSPDAVESSAPVIWKCGPENTLSVQMAPRSYAALFFDL